MPARGATICAPSSPAITGSPTGAGTMISPRADGGDGRMREAGAILRTFGHYVRDGLIPTCFRRARERACITRRTPRSGSSTLHRYVKSGDRARVAVATLVGIASVSVAGTRFGIGVDPADGLLRQGAGLSAHVDGREGRRLGRRTRRVCRRIIMRSGHNALRLLAHWLADTGREATQPVGRRGDDCLFARSTIGSGILRPRAVRCRGRRIRRRRRAGESGLCHLPPIIRSRKDRWRR